MRVWLLMASLLLLAHSALFACDCVALSVPEQWEKADAVFSGKVTAIEKQGTAQFVQFNVYRIWKGISASFVEVSTPVSEAECGYSFKKDSDYLVYATGKEKLHVSLCSRTAPVQQVESDLIELKKLGKSFAPKTIAPSRDPFDTVEGDRVALPTAKVPKTLTVEFAVIVGITKSGKEYIALVKDAYGRIYHMRAGDRLHDGTVKSIDSKGVVFRRGRSTVRKNLHPF